MSNPCTWNGRYYDSYSDLARDKGVTPQTAQRWIKKGHTCDDDPQLQAVKPRIEAVRARARNLS
jgi:hypothetical protein